MALEHEYWKKKKLEEMDTEEWEGLCDGCARCCQYKLQDEDTNEIYYTNVICRLLDTYRCRCSDYPNRARLVPTCLGLNADLVKQLSWMPKTCAYRLVAEGKELAWWHPLVSGSRETVHQAGISVRNKVIPEYEADMENLEDYVVDWLD